MWWHASGFRRAPFAVIAVGPIATRLSSAERAISSDPRTLRGEQLSERPATGASSSSARAQRGSIAAIFAARGGPDVTLIERTRTFFYFFCNMQNPHQRRRTLQRAPRGVGRAG